MSSAMPVVDGVEELAPAPSVSRETQRWSGTTLIACRFAFVYLGFYELPYIVKRFLPNSWRNTAESLGFMEPVVRAFGHAVGIRGELPMVHPGGKDSPFEWTRILFLLLVATVATVIWTAVGRERRSHPLLLEGLRTYLRYGLAFTLIYYATVKLLPIQFAPLGLWGLIGRYGDSTPMSLLWTFMGFSRPYQVATGLVEATGAVLLFWRRTTLLGALIVIGAMANVFMLNVSYDVGVKQYGAHLIAMALVVLAPDAPMLARCLLRREVRRPFAVPAWLAPRWVQRARPWAKTVVILWTTWMTVSILLPTWKARALPEPPPFYGVWLVESFDPLPDIAAHAWHHVAIDERSEARIERLDDTLVWYMTSVDAAKKQLLLATEDDKAATLSAMTYEQTDPSHVRLEGVLDGEHVVVRLHRRDRPFALMKSGFQWVEE